MIIDFNDEELDLIFECLDERRVCSDNEEEINLIDNLYKKVWEVCENGNS